MIMSTGCVTTTIIDSVKENGTTTNSNSNGWDDEAAAMKAPEKYRCHNCKDEFYHSQVRLLKTTNDKGRPIGYFYCLDCMIALKPLGCHWVAYKDRGQYEFLCFNCPIPDWICDLRSKTTLVVKKE